LQPSQNSTAQDRSGRQQRALDDLEHVDGKRALDGRMERLRGGCCDIRKGTVREAILFSCGANVSHGLRRTNPDKHRAVTTLLNDPEWSAYSDRKIADICCVGNSMVSDLRRAQVCDSHTSKPAKRIGADGKCYPATQPKREPVTSTVEDFEPSETVERPVATAERPKANGKPSEPNVIGELRFS
jgi:hypothetical protein